MKKITAAIVLASLHCLAISEPKRLTSQADIEKLIGTIPVTDKSFGYKNIGERMENIGMKIEIVRVDQIRKENAEPPTFIAGDQYIEIFTSNPSEIVRKICPILGSPTYIKRGKKYIPYNRTAYWLMTNRCDFK
jgi:hypothetical protein